MVVPVHLLSGLGPFSAIIRRMWNTNLKSATTTFSSSRLTSFGSKWAPLYPERKVSLPANYTSEPHLRMDESYKKLFSNTGVPELPGLVSFVSQAPPKASVDAASGTVTLQDNHHSEVLVEALAYGKVFSTIGVYCNLLPIDLGDVDLGETVGVPLSSPVVGTTFATAVRVNGGSRGSRAISGYNIQLQYDPEFLEVVAVENSIPSSKGTAELRYSVSTDATSVSIVATVQDSKVSGVAQIASIRFRAKAAGETVITGSVEELVDNTPINPVAIGAQPALFESGTVPILIHDGGKRTARTLDSSSKVLQQRAANYAILPNRGGSDGGSRSRRACGASAINGDMNCDCSLTILDPSGFMTTSRLETSNLKGRAQPFLRRRNRVQVSLGRTLRHF